MAAKPRKSVKMFPLEKVKPMKPTQGLPRTGLPAPVTGSASAVPGFKAAPGRPHSNVGQYLIKPTIEDKSGFEMINDTPDVLDRVKESLRKFELPTALQPKYLRKPEVMENQRKKAISKGFVKPRSRIQ
jgi:hypothetical protein